MTTFHEGMHTAEFIVNEAPNGRSRSMHAMLAAGQNLDAGAIVGKKLYDGASLIADDGNTGDADVSGVTITLGEEVEQGLYVLRCEAASPGGGTFSVTSPTGKRLDDLTVASAYSSTHISMTIPDGNTDWAVGDMLYVEVGSGEYTVLDMASDDGSQVAAGILYAATDASAAPAPCVVIMRDADINEGEIAWPAGISDGEKARAISQLNARGIRLLAAS
jgi:hypothetical protein